MSVQVFMDIYLHPTPLFREHEREGRVLWALVKIKDHWIVVFNTIEEKAKVKMLAILTTVSCYLSRVGT